MIGTRRRPHRVTVGEMIRCALANIAQALRESLGCLQPGERRGVQWMVDPSTGNIVINPLSGMGRYNRYVAVEETALQHAGASPLPASTLTVEGGATPMTEDGAVSGQARVLVSPRAGETPATPAAQDPVLGVTRDPGDDAEVAGLATLSPLTVSTSAAEVISPVNLERTGPDAARSAASHATTDGYSTAELEVAPIPLTTILEAQRAQPRQSEIDRLSLEFHAREEARRLNADGFAAPEGEDSARQVVSI